jgi:Fe-S cluster biogenesis protein NfuA
VVEEKDFQKRVQQIGELVHEIEAVADPAARTGAKQLVQALMDLHGTGLERILEIIFQSGATGQIIINDLGRDPLVSSLLILYGIHPEDLQTRVERTLNQIRSRLFKAGAEATLISAGDGDVRIRVRVEPHSCGSTARAARATVEEAIYEAAPDLKSLVIEGLDEPTASGFVALEKLAGAPNIAAFSDSNSPLAERVSIGSDGMD